MRKIFWILTAILMFALCGCNGGMNGDNDEDKGLGFVLSKYEAESGNAECYSQVALIRGTAKKPSMLEFKKEWEDKYGNVMPALAWKLERNEDSAENKWHVVVMYMESEGVTEEEVKASLDKAVEDINKVYNTNINTEEWTNLTLGYYCVLTEEELLALTQNGFMGGYVGSGEGNHKKMDINTPEGVDIYVELYGDGYVQYVDGKEIKDYTK